MARIGGDEFVILAVETELAEPEVLIDRLQNDLAGYNAKATGKLKISLSIGTSCFDPEKPCQLEEVIDKADKEMYKYKKSHLSEN